MPGLRHKYFVLKPEGTDEYALASREAMEKYADIIEHTDPELAQDLREWMEKEYDLAELKTRGG